jgi:hypothetical protein
LGAPEGNGGLGRSACEAYFAEFSEECWWNLCTCLSSKPTSHPPTILVLIIMHLPHLACTSHFALSASASFQEQIIFPAMSQGTVNNESTLGPSLFKSSQLALTDLLTAVASASIHDSYARNGSIEHVFICLVHDAPADGRDCMALARKL